MLYLNIAFIRTLFLILFSTHISLLGPKLSIHLIKKKGKYNFPNNLECHPKWLARRKPTHKGLIIHSLCFRIPQALERLLHSLFLCLGASPPFEIFFTVTLPMLAGARRDRLLAFWFHCWIEWVIWITLLSSCTAVDCGCIYQKKGRITSISSQRKYASVIRKDKFLFYEVIFFFLFFLMKQGESHSM